MHAGQRIAICEYRARGSPSWPGMCVRGEPNPACVPKTALLRAGIWVSFKRVPATPNGAKLHDTFSEQPARSADRRSANKACPASLRSDQAIRRLNVLPELQTLGSTVRNTLAGPKCRKHAGEPAGRARGCSQHFGSNCVNMQRPGSVGVLGRPLLMPSPPWWTIDLWGLAFRVRNGRNHSRSCDEQTENIGGVHGRLGPEPDG